MKKNIVMTIFVALVVVAVGVVLWLFFLDQNKVGNQEEQTTTKEVAKKDTRELIWEKLPVEQRGRVDGTWESGKLSTIVLDKSAVGWIDNKSYEGKEVYLFDLPTKTTGIPNNMLIYADKDTFEYIGNAPVD